MADPRPSPIPPVAAPMASAAEHAALEARRAAIHQRFRRSGTGLGSQTLHSAVQAFLLKAAP